MFQSLGWQEKAKRTRVPPRGSRRRNEVRVIAREWIYGLCRGIERRESASVHLLSSPRFFLSRSRTRADLPSAGSSAMRPRCGRSCHCSGDRYPSSRLRVKVTTLYLESQLMPPPLSRDHPLIIDEPPSATVLTQLLRNLSPAPAVRHPCSRCLSSSLSRRGGGGGGRSTHFWKTEIGDPDNGDDLSIARRAR